MSGFLALGLARQTGKRRYAFAAATIFLADILTFSRGGYIGLIVGGVVYGLMLVPTMSRVNFRRLAGAALGGVLIFLTFGQSVWSRMITSFSFADASSLERIRLWQEALVAIAQHPVLGVGLGNYIVVARPLYTTGTPFYAHNLYFDIALEIGLLGLFIFLALCLYALGQAFQARHHVPFAPALVAVFVLYLAHSLFETALYSLHVTLMLVFSLALALSFSRFRDTSA
jgi:O-antigen ligase